MIVRFYDPHPGVGGAAIALPTSLRLAAQKLNENKADLAATTHDLQKVLDSIGGGTLTIIDDIHKFILIKIECSGMIHAWRLISFEKMA